jgi:hypothetical protein
VADEDSSLLDARPQYQFSVSNLLAASLHHLTYSLNKDQQAVFSCAIVFAPSFFFNLSQSYTPSPRLLKPGTTSFRHAFYTRWQRKQLA